ncbi:facilitated trehalose transporter Tret1-like isoform X1 [Trichoplusia ni]|uniref:Facilitated trehalose transporter Tret1-like isoform X1 n=1 Tax=Trichoplusia ni TaxID=7111 RepID=A0A7E5VA33_TRINI|nr:facilitated trehalose transporter Tret1-like isoform X1 [Trichoplusia ni]
MAVMKGRQVQYLVAFAVSLAALSSGVNLMWTTPIIPKFHNNETNIVVTDDQISWIAAMSSPGFMTGSLLTRFISDRFGRKTNILLSALPIVTGTVILLNTSSAWWICVTRFIWGTGSGMISTVSAAYLVEISDKDIRGMLTASFRFMVTFGSILVIAVGSLVSYDTLNYMLIAIPMCYFMACSCIPESPYYYLKDEKVDAARRSLMKLSGNKDEVVLEERLSAMRSDVRLEMLRSSSLKELFTGKQYRRALVIGTVLKLTQVMAGTIALQQYVGRIVQESTTSISISTVLMIFGAVRLVVGLLSLIIVDRIGRRPLLLYSFVSSASVLATVGAYFLILPNSSPYFTYIPFIGITLSNTIAILGYDTLVFIIPAEIFPLNVKSVALTYFNMLGGITNFLSVKGFQEIKDLAGLTGVFWFYTITCIIGAVFTYFMVPETKGKSLREIQIELQGRYYDEANEKLNKLMPLEDIKSNSLKGDIVIKTQEKLTQNGS